MTESFSVLLNVGTSYGLFSIHNIIGKGNLFVAY